MTIPKTLREKWDEAEETGEPVEIGDIVVCDVCDGDYTDNTDSGGFIFGSYAYCPSCAISRLPNIRGYGEEHLIKARCPAYLSFADFVRKYRQDTGSTALQILTDPRVY